MTNEEKTFQFYVSVLFQTVEELSHTLAAFRQVVNTHSDAVHILNLVAAQDKHQDEMQHQIYNALRQQAVQSVQGNDLLGFAEAVDQLRAKARRWQ